MGRENHRAESRRTAQGRCFVHNLRVLSGACTRLLILIGSSIGGFIQKLPRVHDPGLPPGLREVTLVPGDQVVRLGSLRAVEKAIVIGVRGRSRRRRGNHKQSDAREQI